MDVICVDQALNHASQLVRSGQNVGRILSGDYVERMLICVDWALNQASELQGI